jgi:glucuronate isomerase
MPESNWYLDEYRFFDPEPTQRRLAAEIYASIVQLPIVSPHGHVDARLFADEIASFGNPTELFIIPDHYVFRMLHSQGIPLEKLGVPRRDGGTVESDPRKIWQLFSENFYLFRGTPSGAWLSHELISVFEIHQKLDGKNAQAIYDEIAHKLALPAFRPRALYESFKIEVLCTTDTATDPLQAHQTLRSSGWKGNIRPTFRPDGVVDLLSPGWVSQIQALGELTGQEIGAYQSYIQALEQRREFFKSMGATATDHAALVPHTEALSPAQADAIFQRALRSQASPEDAAQFTAHMLMEMARMSTEDGLVMQLHPGSLRNHSQDVFATFGADKGFDIPTATEYTRNLRPLLQAYGRHPRLRLILFTLDETSYSRELAPLAGVYPALKLGPPWWFFDSLNGMQRYFETVMETAGLYNTAGFNDDTRAFASIPARHDLWRRASANWLAGLAARHILDMAEAQSMAQDMAYGLARAAYHLD